MTTFDTALFQCPELLVLPFLCDPLLVHEAIEVQGALPFNTVHRMPASGPFRLPSLLTILIFMTVDKSSVMETHVIDYVGSVYKQTLDKAVLFTQSALLPSVRTPRSL